MLTLHTIVRRAALFAALSLPLAASFVGCANRGGGRVAPHAAARGITIDGDTSDWPRAAASLADAHYVYFRVGVENQQMPIQASTESLALWLDADGDPATGQRMDKPTDAASLGVDLVLEFSPRKDDGTLGRGVSGYAIDATGNKTPVSQGAVELVVSPSTGGPQFEIRLARRTDEPSTAEMVLAGPARNARAMFVIADATGKITGWSDPESFVMPASADGPARASALLPVKRPGTIRVVSYNVLKSALMANDAPFRRVFQVLQPDVVLLQEWDTDEATARAWFSAMVTGNAEWHARSTGKDVVIVSPYPIESLGLDGITIDSPDGSSANPVRYIAGVVKTPLGDVAAASVHLKCCGTAGSPEDIKRINEARAIQAAMRGGLGDSGPRLRVIGGDLNLVGSTTPLDAIRVGLDADGSELMIAPTRVLGDAAFYTWMDPKSEFPAGRLDYLLFSDASADVVNAFVFDTTRLDDASLFRLGLDRADTASSDHKPIVLDLKPR
ncbi:MAG: endonuclease/exonuclease/phosphatase family protein [Phycisphaerae bacterium]|nr:endonuclease/exonuclease/phosphatase family protein [Phycisphaerae bacterium]